jgi:hypothetical protein
MLSEFLHIFYIKVINVDLIKSNLHQQLFF